VPTTDAVLAIDLGTGLLKAGIVGLDGRVLAEARATHPTDHGPEQAEQDPLAWWAAVVAGAGDLRAGAHDARVVAVAVVGQGPTCVAATADGTPTRPAIAWLDRRPVDVREELAVATGRPGWTLGILPAALWIERNEPAVAARTTHYLAAWEWLAMRLSGVAAATVTAGQTLPDPTVLARVGLPTARIPPATPAGTAIGALGADAAAALGLEPGIPVVAGTNDAFASCLGAGLLEAGHAIDTGGSAGGLAIYAAREPRVPGAWVAPAPLPDRWLVGGAMAATGAALDWLRDDILGGAAATEALDTEAAAVPAGADGLLFLPYLAGERSPIWDADARGAFVGLTVGHGRGHLVRAVLEAAAHALRHVAEPIAAAGFPMSELRVCGGGARSATWNRIKADVLGVPVAVPEVTETAMLGAAMLGAVGIDARADLRAAIASMVRVAERIEPDPATRAIHDARHAVYRELYPALRAAMHQLGAEGLEAEGSSAAARPPGRASAGTVTGGS
jgi:xylulokinase